MSLISWSEQLSVGIDSIDDQHKKLINMINALDDALAEGRADDVLQKIFDGLTVYTVKHFSYEEDLFALYNYPETQDHNKEHQALIEEVKSLQKKMKEGDFMIGIEVMSFLKLWLTNHILKTDMAYAPYLKMKGVK